MFEIKKHHLINFLILIWLSHFIQVLVPETGFDAVWYHLPVVKSLFQTGRLIFSPELYQSVNPLFSDLFFYVGYFFFQDIGTKIVAFLFAVSLALASYKLARFFLSEKSSLATTILISTFQVISWQASSFYVDLAKAFWEVLAIIFLLKNLDTKNIKYLFLSALVFGASLGTKLFSIFLIPVYFLMLIILPNFRSKFMFKKIILLLVTIFLIPIFFYLNSYFQTGNPFYSFGIHLDKLSEIGGDQNIFKYFLSRTQLLLLSPFQLIISRDYVSPLLSILIIPVMIKIKEIIKSQKLLILLIFSVFQWFLWWYLPPLSTRYALSGFITLLVLEIAVIKNYFFNNLDNKSLKYSRMSEITSKINEKNIILVLVFFAILNLLPRLYVNYRSLSYLFSDQTQKTYVEKFYDGSIDQKLKDWYGY